MAQKPKISAQLKNKLEDKLKQINSILREKYESEEHVGVLTGLSGIALFQFYYAKHINIEKFSDWGQDTLDAIIKKINQGYKHPTFSSGIAGAAWVFNHLQNLGFIELDNDILSNRIDKTLHAIMILSLKKGNYDFLHGAMGYASYFLIRYNTSTDEKLKNRYKNYILNFIEELDKISIKDHNGIKWEYALEQKNYYNLSLSHGISSIIIFLSKLNTYKEFRNKSEPLLMGAVKFLKENELPSNISSISRFPSFVSKNENKDKNSRLAWCYGDFGVALALLKASKALKNNSLKEKALSILDDTILRKDQSNTKVIDAGICHGTFGNAQVYNYLYKETLNNNYHTAATFWIKKGLELSTYPDGYAGFKQWFGIHDEWIPTTSLLEGIAGIGLSIIDYLSEESNSWDECLLLS